MVQILESEHQYNFLSKTFILLPIPNYEYRKSDNSKFYYTYFC